MSVEIPNIEDKIREIFLDVIREDWMTEEDVQIVLDESLAAVGMDMDKLLKQILIGVENGYSIEEQFNIIKEIFKKDE